MELVIDYLPMAVLFGMIVLTFARQSRRKAAQGNDGSSGWVNSGDGCDAGADGGCDGGGGGD